MINKKLSEKDYLNHQGRYRTVADPDLERPLFVERSEEKGVRTFRSDSIKPARSRRMGRAMRVVVVGGKKVGKTAILRQVACVEDVTNKVRRLKIIISVSKFLIFSHMNQRSKTHIKFFWKNRTKLERFLYCTIRQEFQITDRLN